MTQQNDQTFNRDGLGVWTEESRFEVTRERVQEYAAATNDPIEAHRAGDVASPVFAIVPVFQSLIEPALEVVPMGLIGKIVHGEQDFRFHRPVRPGDVLVSRSRMTGWQGLPNGTAACVHIECRAEGTGELVNEQYVTFFVRGFDNGDTVGELAPEHRFDETLLATEPVAETKQHIDDDQTYRYGPAAGDPMPIHLDEEFAKEMGLPGIIAHGLCTQAFTSWAALTELAGSDVGRLRRHAVRFAKPVLPGQDVVTTFYRVGSPDGADGVTTYAFQSAVDGDLVIKDGLVEIADTTAENDRES
ncbi:MaoC/PaaZ C-terminal domain-containing protein [Nocardioides stalactiti]|uniref:MaoC/PaaZ C-terminal domain-containing protein n=1 Tax=Nocardioides stalactiti TaxID=2755356 RepID=UPI0016037E68|nr:MaoC/PaaZ C-terminal domain-containing protein [Nocardioides stalactiti]